MMKKSLMLLIATLLAAFMTACGGGGGSSASSHSGGGGGGGDNTTPQSDVSFDAQPEESATNVTYKTTAQGDFPPAPPSSSLAKTQEEANKLL
jgi:ABC-type phosphate/phosphonate transport system substrate-binding protein